MTAPRSAAARSHGGGDDIAWPGSRWRAPNPRDTDAPAHNICGGRWTRKSAPPQGAVIALGALARCPRSALWRRRRARWGAKKKMQQGHTSPLTPFHLQPPPLSVAVRRRIYPEASSVLTTTAGNAATLKRLSNK